MAAIAEFRNFRISEFFIILLILFVFVIVPLPGQANQEQPLEITADDTLEWHRQELRFIALGNAAARQGDITIKADILTADYRESEESAFDIYRLTAEGNVFIETPEHTVQGGRATYEIDQGTALMTGGNLVMTTPEQTVTAQDSFEYSMTDGRLTARGNALVTNGEDSLAADTISAYFTRDNNGRNQLRRLSARGNIVLKTPTETLYGDRGEYHADTETAEVTGNVRIERGPNVLEGDRAEVDLNTSVSRIHGGGLHGEGGRVRGTFYPDSE